MNECQRKRELKFGLRNTILLIEPKSNTGMTVTIVVAAIVFLSQKTSVASTTATVHMALLILVM